MKIDNSAKSVGGIGGTATSRAPAGSRAVSEGARIDANAQATIVSASLSAVAGAEPAFDAQKVAEIRQAIAEGRFQINPERIADGLIDSVRQMLGREGGTSR